MFYVSVNSNVLCILPSISHSIDICTGAIKNIRNVQAVSTNQITDILHFNDDGHNIFIRNEKIVWKYRPYYWYFCLNLKYLGCPYREYIKTVKNDGFYEELLSENDFEAVLATFCCYDYGANASEAVQKIATDQKDYHKCSSCVIVCWIGKIYQSITMKKGWLLGQLRRS